LHRYNVIVIGGGAAGLTVAGGAALLGARVALVERDRLGGECLHTGCVPSKALLHVARVAHLVRTASDHAVRAAPLPRQDLAAVMRYVRAAQARIAPHDAPERFQAMGVEVIRGAARLRSPHEVEVAGTGDVLWARHIVVATGSRPLVPDVAGLDEAGYLTSESVFDLETLPEALLVIGGGPIGAELGQAFARLGSAVTVVNDAEHLLPREDADVAEVLARQFEREGIAVLNRSAVARVERRDGRLRATLQTPEGPRALDVDRILVAAGRRPSVEGLGLEAVGVAVGAAGVEVSPAGRTTVPSIWAVGDVTASHRFTHWAGHRARLVVRNILFPGSLAADPDMLPWTTFTQPEVARLGPSEAEARARGLAYDRRLVPFTEIDRAVCDGETDGFVKVLTRRGGGKILGAAIVHARAGELIGELTLARTAGVGLGRIARAIHVYPTLSDAHRAVADQYMLGRLTPRLRRVLSVIFRWLRR
jgi:pyruvate/2-oxoglutarate dehydrogenase complex dihydrolipoamide dehydrogenase (E3) component